MNAVAYVFENGVNKSVLSIAVSIEEFLYILCRKESSRIAL